MSSLAPPAARPGMSPYTATLRLALATLLGLAYSSEARAQGLDAVHVVLAGGIRELPTYDLLTEQGPLPEDPERLVGTYLGALSLGLGNRGASRVSLTDADRPGASAVPFAPGTVVFELTGKDGEAVGVPTRGTVTAGVTAT